MQTLRFLFAKLKKIDLLWLARSMPLEILSLKPEAGNADVTEVPVRVVDADEGRGRILNLRSGEGSLEITIKFWTVKFLFALFSSRSLTSSDTSKDVMAVMVLN